VSGLDARIAGSDLRGTLQGLLYGGLERQRLFVRTERK
jgi:hypothetical protein